MSTTRQVIKVYIVTCRERNQRKVIEEPWRDPEAASGRLLSGVEEVQVGLRDEKEGVS